MKAYRARRPVGTPGTGNTPDIAGVYYFRNRANDRMYVGQSREIYTRLNAHVSKLLKGRHRNEMFQADWTSFGQPSFEFGILVTTTEQSPLSILELEDIFIRVYQSNNPAFGYNVR